MAFPMDEVLERSLPYLLSCYTIEHPLEIPASVTEDPVEMDRRIREYAHQFIESIDYPALTASLVEQYMIGYLEPILSPNLNHANLGELMFHFRPTNLVMGLNETLYVVGRGTIMRYMSDFRFTVNGPAWLAKLLGHDHRIEAPMNQYFDGVGGQGRLQTLEAYHLEQPGIGTMAEQTERAKTGLKGKYKHLKSVGYSLGTATNPLLLLTILAGRADKAFDTITVLQYGSFRSYERPVEDFIRSKAKEAYITSEIFVGDLICEAYDVWKGSLYSKNDFIHLGLNLYAEVEDSDNKSFMDLHNQGLYILSRGMFKERGQGALNMVRYNGDGIEVLKLTIKNVMVILRKRK